MGIEETILAKYRVKVTKHEADGMNSLCGEKMQVKDGKHFFEIPAGFAQYYKEMFPLWTVSDPYIPEENQPKAYMAEEKEIEYKYACTLCGFKCNSAQVLEIHPCTNVNPIVPKKISDRAAEKNRRIDALIAQDKADSLNKEKCEDARFGKRKNKTDVPAPSDGQVEDQKPELELEQISQ